MADQRKGPLFMSRHSSAHTAQECSYTTRSYVLQLATVCDGHSLRSLATAGSHFLHGFHHIHTLDNLSEHYMLAIQPRGWYGAQEELRTVGARACVSHRQYPGPSVLPHKVLICKLCSVDGLASGTIAVREVTTLAHETRNDTVKVRALEVEGLPQLSDSFLASAQGPEVFSRLRSCVGV